MEPQKPIKQFLENRKSILAIKDSSMLEGSSSSSSFQLPSSFHPLELEISRTESSRKRNQAQGKLLLVALLENYCMLYDQSKEQNQQLFFMLCQYLCRMGIIDSTDFLEEFTSVRASYKRAFKELVVKALQTVKEMEDVATRERELIVETAEGLEQPLMPKSLVPSPHLGARLRLPQLVPRIPIDITELLDTNQSRFEEDFEEICLLGRGAFGKVLQCRSKMDSRHYAVKIVKTDSSGGSELAKILREVKLLADIEHQNVVRYYGSWFQFTNPINGGQSDSEAEEDDQSFSTSAPIASSSPSVIPASLHSYNSSGATSTIKSKPLTLFIQMELCQHTLKNYIEDLNREVNTFRRMEGKILYCFLDLLKGVQVIHEKSYIHRDIKPSNIYWKFANGNQSSNTTSSLSTGATDNMRAGCWKIGDFGLATWIQTNLDEGMSQQQQQSYGVGTITYASPEQLLEEKHGHHTISKPASYSYETDIYSLGLILFELLYPFDTGMERVKVLTDLRLGILPEDFVTELPKEAALILWMMSKEPASRPLIADILKLEWFTSPQQQQRQAPLSSHSECCGCNFSIAASEEMEQSRKRENDAVEELRIARLRIQELELENKKLQERLDDYPQN